MKGIYEEKIKGNMKKKRKANKKNKGKGNMTKNVEKKERTI